LAEQEVLQIPPEHSMKEIDHDEIFQMVFKENGWNLLHPEACNQNLSNRLNAP
jgi:hypothetical protein